MEPDCPDYTRAIQALRDECNFPFEEIADLFGLSLEECLDIYDGTVVILKGGTLEPLH